MKDPRSYIERFCARHPNFGIPRLMLYVAVGNAVFWLLGVVNTRLWPYLAFDPYLVLHGQVWRLISFALIPPSTRSISTTGSAPHSSSTGVRRSLRSTFSPA